MISKYSHMLGIDLEQKRHATFLDLAIEDPPMALTRSATLPAVKYDK